MQNALLVLPHKNALSEHFMQNTLPVLPHKNALPERTGRAFLIKL